MKAVIASLAMASCLLAGCTSTSSGSGTGYTDHRSRYHQRIVKDVDYIQAVEEQAARQRVEIYWVNPPTKRVANKPDRD